MSAELSNIHSSIASRHLEAWLPGIEDDEVCESLDPRKLVKRQPPLQFRCGERSEFRIGDDYVGYMYDSTLDADVQVRKKRENMIVTG